LHIEIPARPLQDHSLTPNIISHVIGRAFRHLLALFLLALLPAAISGFIQLEWRGPRDPLEPGEVRPGTAKMWGEHVLWVDTRSRKKYEALHIPGAVHLSEDEWERCIPGFLDVWSPEKTIVVYCEDGKDQPSHAVAERLRGDLQLESVYVLKGGWEAWRKQ
jgi:rhodanese-related sulfurtransferase